MAVMPREVRSLLWRLGIDSTRWSCVSWIKIALVHSIGVWSLGAAWEIFKEMSKMS